MKTSHMPMPRHTSPAKIVGFNVFALAFPTPQIAAIMWTKASHKKDVDTIKLEELAHRRLLLPFGIQTVVHQPQLLLNYCDGSIMIKKALR
jgi:hypothetical protein